MSLTNQCSGRARSISRYDQNEILIHILILKSLKNNEERGDKMAVINDNWYDWDSAVGIGIVLAGIGILLYGLGEFLGLFIG